ncbi:hypothetical protein BKA70DRAFT_1439057 [Coprinopsis sp. MPI-PUGE-AT-0042]|nr:hypothetical protein BKA70DRAFT_1439057 [Coprinopsis sp. MPI-PUGE-AT-0042]
MPHSFEYPHALGLLKPEWDSVLEYVNARLVACMAWYKDEGFATSSVEEQRIYVQNLKREICIGMFLFGCATLQVDNLDMPMLLRRVSALMVGRRFSKESFEETLENCPTPPIDTIWLVNVWWTRKGWCGMTAAYMITAWRIYSAQVASGYTRPAPYCALLEELGDQAQFVLPTSILTTPEDDVYPFPDDDELEHLRRLSNSMAIDYSE